MATRIAVMNKGVLQQVDTPQVLYAHPKNQFVAGFIGSPAMNFFAAKLTEKAGGLYVESENMSLKVHEERHKLYENLIGKPVVFGIRPEDIHNPIFTPSGIISAETECMVEITELMGNEIFLYLNNGNTKFVARVDPRSNFKVGEKIKLVFNMANMHLFDPSEDNENPPAIQ